MKLKTSKEKEEIIEASGRKHRITSKGTKMQLDFVTPHSRTVQSKIL